MIYKTNGKNQKRTIRNLFAALLAVICLAAFALPAGTLAEAVPAAGTLAEAAPAVGTAAEAVPAAGTPAEAAPAAGTMAEAAPAAGTPISCKAARVFDGTLDSAQTLTTWEIAGHAQ